MNDVFVLHSGITDFVDTIRLYLEADEGDIQTSAEIRSRLCSFVCNLLKPVPLEHRRNVFSSQQRSRLYYLLARSAGRYGMCFAPAATGSSAAPGANSFALQMGERSSTSSLQRLTLALGASSASPSSTATRPSVQVLSAAHPYPTKGFAVERDDGDSMGAVSDLEFASLRAMCALLCCGTIFSDALLSGDDPGLFRGLDALAASRDSRVCAPFTVHTVLVRVLLAQ